MTPVQKRNLKDKLKVAGVILMAVLLFWSMLTSKMYETAREQGQDCRISGGVWVEPEIRPWNLVEGVCQ